MKSLSLEAKEEEIIEFAKEWTKYLENEEYQRAWEMLYYVPRTGVYQKRGESWVSSAEQMKAWIVNYGTSEPLPDEPTYKVTSIESAKIREGDILNHGFFRANSYPSLVARLDWRLPLNGFWSDLLASFDIVSFNERLAFILVALRIP